LNKALQTLFLIILILLVLLFLAPISIYLKLFDKNDEFNYVYAEGNIFEGSLTDVSFRDIDIDKISYNLPIEQALTKAEIELDDKFGSAELTLNLPSLELQIHNFTINIIQDSSLLDEIKVKTELHNFTISSNGYCLSGQGTADIVVSTITTLTNLQVLCVAGEIKIYHLNEEIIYFGTKDNNYFAYLNSAALPNEFKFIFNNQVIAIPLTLL
tara:strand:+ start:10661 stop:11299 length:639 start_codon:yes stop_codon:yes gene_type:complete